MKKTVKALITAASVAAVVGIGAVSFAAWSAGTGSSEGGALGGTGNTVETLGGLSVVYTSGSSDPLAEGSTSFNVTDKLVPYDQDLTNSTSGQAVLATGDGITNVTYMVFQVTNDADSDEGITYKINGGLTSTDAQYPVGNARLMYKASATAPTGAPANTTGYTNITATATEMKGFESGSYVTVIMVASGNDAKNVSWNILFSATAGGTVSTGYDMKANGELVASLEEVEASAGESVVYVAKKVTLDANSTLTFAIKDKDTSSIKGADDTDDTKAGKATVAANVVTVADAGTYNVYFKQKTGNTTDWFVWVEYPAPEDGRVACNGGGYLVGQFEGDPEFFWNYGWEMEANKAGTEYSITIDLKAGDVIKFREAGTGRGYDVFEGTTAAMACFEDAGKDENIKVKTAGKYTFYLKKTANTQGKYIWVEKE